MHIRAKIPSGISWLSGGLPYPTQNFSVHFLSQSRRVPIKPRFFAISQL